MDASGRYVLRGREVVRLPDGPGSSLEWARAFEAGNRRVAETFVDLPGGDGEKLRVSTVFLGIDHNFRDAGPPILFETMVFGLSDDMQDRCATYDEAEAMHARVVAEVRARIQRGHGHD